MAITGRDEASPSPRGVSVTAPPAGALDVRRPLSSQPLARSRQFGELHDAIDGLTENGHRIMVDPGERLRGAVDGVRLGPISLVSIRYGVPLAVESLPTRRRILLVFPLAPMAVESGGQRWSGATPFALSTVHGTRLYPAPEHGAIVGAVDAEVFEDHLARTVGRGVRGPIELSARERPLRLAAPGLVQSAWIEACRLVDGGNAEDDMARATLAEHLLSSMAVGLAPHLQRMLPIGPAVPGPDYLAVACAYLRRRHGEQVRLSDVALAAGISMRQLHSGFATHLGTSPASYLRGVRLDRARALLGEPARAHAVTVSSVAAEVGCRHLGRFSGYYEERFGEQPSQTLSRARAAR